MSDDPSDPKPPKGKRGAKPGHPYYPNKRRKINTRQLAAAVRDRIPAEIYVEFHLQVASGHDARLATDEEGELVVTWDERGGLMPSLDTRLASMKWLADRGYGQAPQMIQLEAELRASGTATILPAGALPPTTLVALARLLLPKSPDPTANANAPALPESTSASEIIDAEFSEHDDSTSDE